MPIFSPRRRRVFGLVTLVSLGVLSWWRIDGVREVEVKAAARREGGHRPDDGRLDAHAGTSPTSMTAPDGNVIAPALFSFVEPAEAAELNSAFPAPAGAIRYVRVNRALAVGKASPFWQPAGRGRIEIPLPEGEAMVARINHSEMLGPRRFTSTGTIEGRPGSRVLFAWNEGHVHASFEAPGHGTYALRVATAELSQFYRIDPERVPPCGGARLPRREAIGPGLATNPLPPAWSQPPLAAAENPQRSEVHVMMLYTPSVLPTLPAPERHAAVQSAFDLAIAKVNSAFDASLITARVKLVRVAETSYDESASGPSQVQDDALTALYQETDGKMDDVHALRDAAGADIVCLALNRSDTASSGLSFLLDTPDEPTNARFAFSIVQYGNITGTNVVAHELGHVLGCAHDRENAMSGAGAFSYSYGYRFVGADGLHYHDIMSYPPGTELAYFSNPDIIVPAPVNAPIGIPAGRPGESNSAQTIERTAFYTSGYRLQTQAAASAGSLINVATRAFVGTGDDVMIGGFFIEGAQPKRMLIRAAGPALRTFGVEGALPDPVLRLMANGTPVAENDNWDQPGPGNAPAAEISGAAAQVGAFAFPNGGADAALLITLPPGAYSAVVEDRMGATGHGLVEAYEVERGLTRIVNLATRAFSGPAGRELVGGFVVEGAAGATKRILIRVLGPTLARPPFNVAGAMDDPEMEIRNASGAQLMYNDDWSSGAEGGASQENDFHPLVDLYGEKQIFATGLAPANRREPCVLVDLPPGSYTVTVRPYELRSANPLRDQPPVPGVGIIEVYEIKQ